jgi:hypothetical protein
MEQQPYCIDCGTFKEQGVFLGELNFQNYRVGLPLKAEGCTILCRPCHDKRFSAYDESLRKAIPPCLDTVNG